MCAGVSFLDVRGDISERKAEAVKKQGYGNTTVQAAKNFSNKFFAACTVVNKRYDL